MSLDDLVGCMRRDGLVGRLTVAAQAAISDLVLLAGAVAPAATRIFTCRFFAHLLLDVILSCVTLGGLCSCTLGAGRMFLVIERVCLAVPLSDSNSVVACWLVISLLCGDDTG